jgi:hypothetical protein
LTYIEIGSSVILGSKVSAARRGHLKLSKRGPACRGTERLVWRDLAALRAIIPLEHTLTGADLEKLTEVARESCGALRPGRELHESNIERSHAASVRRAAIGAWPGLR